MSVQQLCGLSSRLKNSISLVRHRRAYSSSLSETTKAINENGIDTCAIRKKVFTEGSPNASKILFSLKNSKVINASIINNTLLNLLAMKYKYKYKENRISNQILNKLCSLIVLNVHKLTVAEAVDICKKLFNLHVPVSSEVMKLMLKIIEDSKEELSLKDKSMLFTIFGEKINCKFSSNIDTTPVKSLETVDIFENTIETLPMKKNDIKSLINALFLAYNSKDTDQITEIVNKIDEYYNGDIPGSKAVLILKTLQPLDFTVPNNLNLLKKMQDIVIKDIDSLRSYAINDLMYTFNRYHYDTKVDIYNAELLDSIVNKIIMSDMGLNLAIIAISCILILRHKNVNILNYACAADCEKRTLKNGPMAKINQYHMSQLLHGISEAGHINIFWDEILQNFLQDKSMMEYDFYSLCQCTLDLIILGHYPEHILQKIFSSKDFSRVWWIIIKIYQAIKTNPKYNGPLLSEIQLLELESHYQLFLKNKKSDFSPLHSYLETGLGGINFVKTNVSTKLFHDIDHVIVYGKDEIPISINSAIYTNSESIDYMEDLEIPQGSRIIAIKLVPNTWYFRNTGELFGSHQLYFKTLKAMSCLPILIPEETWNNLKNECRTSFLMNEIKSKLNSV